MKAPFPYFGGKSKIAKTVWALLGDPENYVEPFAGSLAVLMDRPNTRVGRIETVNDFDGLLANVWRAVAIDPDSVADWADWPVNEADLHARHLWLIGQREPLTARLMADPTWFDAQAAGWWVWGACCWIGSGWCSGKGPWAEVDGELVDTRKLPHSGTAGVGINRQLPHLGDAGVGINRQLPHLGDGGRGINRKLPRLGDAGRGDYIREIFAELGERLRDVRVVCGDFERVLSPSVTTRLGVTGVFLDPPYSDDANRTRGLYAKDCGSVAHRARDWAMIAGCDPKMRIVLAGYDGEHDNRGLELLGWSKHAWKATGGYGSQGSGRGRVNAGREVLWASPGCIRLGAAE